MTVCIIFCITHILQVLPVSRSIVLSSPVQLLLSLHRPAQSLQQPDTVWIYCVCGPGTRPGQPGTTLSPMSGNTDWQLQGWTIPGEMFYIPSMPPIQTTDIQVIVKDAPSFLPPCAECVLGSCDVSTVSSHFSDVRCCKVFSWVVVAQSVSSSSECSPDTDITSRQYQHQSQQQPPSFPSAPW